MSEYGKQIKAVFHFAFKHLFEIEFGIRVAVEILIFFILIYMLLKVWWIILGKIKGGIEFVKGELITPLRVRLYEKLAFSTSNPNWQERANKIKDAFKENMGERIGNKKKSRVGWWILGYIAIVAWIVGFHYFGEEKRNNYEVLFEGENAILSMEEWITDIIFYTDENSIECFFHNELEIN